MDAGGILSDFLPEWLLCRTLAVHCREDIDKFCCSFGLRVQSRLDQLRTLTGQSPGGIKRKWQEAGQHVSINTLQS